MTMLPDPRRTKARKASTTAVKVWGWLSSRRTSRAIAANKALTLSVAASVAATGVAGYGAVQANQAQHGVASLQSQVNQMRQDALATTTQAAFLAADVKKLDTKSAKQLHALRLSLNAMGLSLDRLAAQVDRVPVAPSLAPVYARIAKAAKDADRAVKQANIATASAASQHDDEARYQAGLANDAAGSAAAAARDAQKKAEVAQSKAEAAQKALDALPTPPPAVPPATTVYHLQDFTFPADVGTLDYSSYDTSAFAPGEYKVTLEADTQGYAYDWYLHADGLTLHGTGGENLPRHDRGTKVMTLDSELKVTVEVTGGDDIHFSNVTLSVTRVS